MGRYFPNPRDACALALVLALAGCAAAGAGGGAGTGPAAEIEAALLASAEGWNRGDLAAFLEPYSASTTFVGSAGLLRGKGEVEAMYRRSYFGGAEPPTLRFADIEVRLLGPDHALALGRYLLYDAAGTLTAQGPFSLVWARTGEGWRIVHDHSS